MNFLRNSISAICALLFFISCNKQTDFTSDVSVGTLKKDAGGQCLPITATGLFVVDSVLNDNSYVDVQVNVTAQGTYEISTDTVNGFYFSRTGGVGAGLRNIRLYAKGKPINPGNTAFRIRYGTSTCTFNISVGGGTVPAVYALGGAPGLCTGFVIGGTYVTGTPLTTSNTVSLSVNVSAVGSYSISTTAVNGVSFSAVGQFTTLGPQIVTLAGSGTPVTGGSFPITVNANGSSCSFSLAVVGPAVYTLGGAGSTCTGVVLGGTYNAGIILSASNTATVNVNVTTTGAYNISTTAVNGITFASSGVFTTTGAQTVALNGSGTPAAAGNFSFPVTGGSSTCNFSVTVNPTPVAGYTINCANSTVNGQYYVGTALTASNTITISVNVTSIGTYTITTLPAVNGISFSKTGVFTGTGVQNVTLAGTGTPTAGGSFNYTITGAGNNCSVSILTNTGVPPIYRCKVDGVLIDFTDRAHAEKIDIFTGLPYLFLDGYTGPPNGNTVPEFQIFITKNDNSPVGTGTYNENGFLLPNGYRIEIDYKVLNPDMSVTIWNTSSNILPPAHPPFTITITSVTATRVAGTFSGQLTNTLQGSTSIKNVTEGVFDLPYQ